MKYALPFLILSFLVINGWQAQAGSNESENYILQKRCEKRAAEYLKEQYANREYDDAAYLHTTTYTNHYNKNLNKCFIVAKSQDTPTIINSRSRIFNLLFDINEMKDYGTFFAFDISNPVICEVSGKHCNSEAEWNTLVKPYMEE